MICVTIDCEQWNAPLLRGKNVKENGNTDYSKQGNEVLIKCFSKNKIQTTFFVTGFFAEKEPDQVTKIKNLGHEIACHGYTHFFRGNKNLNLDYDIAKAKKILEKTIRSKVMGFRSPQLQFSDELINVLENNNFRYDSSLHPCFFPFYKNNIKSPITPHYIGKNKRILELPLAVNPIVRFPISFIWARNLGYTWLKTNVKALLKRKINPILYFHSWEFTEVHSKNVPNYIIRKTGKTFVNFIDKLKKDFKKERFNRLCDLLLYY